MKFEFLGAHILVESARGRATVEFSQIGVVDPDEGTGDGSKSHIQVVAVHIAEIVEVRISGIRQCQFDEGGWGLSSDASALNAEVVGRSSTVSSSADELPVFPVAASSGPISDGDGVGCNLDSILSVGRHFPSGLGHEWYTEPSNPDSFPCTILEPEGSRLFPGLG